MKSWVGIVFLAFLITLVVIGCVIAVKSFVTLSSEKARVEGEYREYRRVTERLLGKGAHFTLNEEWVLKPHVEAVQKVGAEECFSCHKESSCLQCHIDLQKYVPQYKKP